VETIRYTALSHSWGLGGIDFKLTENRLDEFQERIPFSNLPATHQDAVVLARKLGLQYAWIDSLCIIQDSTADCQTETVNMGDVYSNAYLTISTVSSPGSKVPFLEAQEAAYAAHPVQFYSPRLNYATRDILGFSGLRRTRLAQLRSHTTLYARRTQKLAAPSVDSTSWSAPQGISDSVQGPLSKRAWTLQERILATRIIHFTSEGLCFECATHFKSQDGRVSASEHLSVWHHLETPDGSPELRTKLQRFWRLMLSDYTQRGITRRSDLLPALSSLAGRMQDLHGAEYLAGLWRDRLIEDLCWAPQGTKYKKPRRVLADEANLPSWSWVSVAHPTIYPVINEPGRFVPHCEVVSCSTDLTESQWNRFGQVMGGELVLRGPVRKAKLTYVGQTDIGGSRVDFGGGSTSELEEDAWMVSFEQEVAGVREKGWRRAVEGEESKWDEAEVWCLKVGTWKMGESVKVLTGLDQTFVMVLGRSSRVEGAFERLGFLEKVYGGSSFDNVGGIIGMFERLAEHGLSDVKKRWEKLQKDPPYPEAVVMEVTIV